MFSQLGQLCRSVATALLLTSFAVRATVLVDFQVAQPPPLPQDAKQCTVQILQYVKFRHVQLYASQIGISTLQAHLRVLVWTVSLHILGSIITEHRLNASLQSSAEVVEFT